MPKNILEIHNLTKIFVMGGEKIRAVNNVNFVLRKGDFVSIMGTSGSGKTTFLNLLGGLDYPDSGDILFEGKNILKMSNKELDELRLQKIGFIFQTFNLLPVLTALENVMFPLSLTGISKEKQNKKAIEVLTYMGLKERFDHRPAELSAGEKQRVAVARALVNNPLLILADEPTGNLDSKTGEEIAALFQKINKERGTSIVLITHDEEIAKTAGKIFRMRDGKISN